MKKYLVALFLLLPSAAFAQSGSRVVTSCGTLPLNYTAGSTQPPTVDVTGKVCTNSTGGGGGGTSAVDASAFTTGTTPITTTGGIFNDAATLTSGQTGAARLTTKRAQIVDTDTTGNALYSAVTAPVPCLSATTSTTNSYTTGSTSPANCDLNGNLYVNAKITGSAPVTNAGTFPVQSTGAANVTATPCSGTVTTGGTAVNAFTAQTTLHGFTILNTDTTEVMWVSFTTTAAAGTADSYPVPAGTPTTFAGAGSFTAPPGFGLNHALSVVAATTGHKFSCTWW